MTELVLLVTGMSLLFYCVLLWHVSRHGDGLDCLGTGYDDDEDEAREGRREEDNA